MQPGEPAKQSDFSMQVASKNRANERIAAGELALEVMHEVRNPLEALGHLVYLIRQESQDPEQVLKYVGMAEEQMVTMNRIVSETLGFARVTSVARPSDLVELAEAALRIHQRKIDARKIHLVRDLSQGVVATIRTGAILQVVSNLIVNALDALPAEGTLVLRLRKRKNVVQILVADNGCGIPAEHTADIFEPFFTTKAEKGTGLGLALSRKIIEGHGGRIGVRSSMRPGKSGTTFRICLPA